MIKWINYLETDSAMPGSGAWLLNSCLSIFSTNHSNSSSNHMSRELELDLELELELGPESGLRKHLSNSLGSDNNKI